MKILKIVQGFTTNSSGSYEWLPGGIYADTNGPPAETQTSIDQTQAEIKSTSTQQETGVAQTKQQNNLDQYHFFPQTSGGLVLFFVSLASGIIAMTMILTKIVKNISADIKKLKKSEKNKK